MKNRNNNDCLTHCVAYYFGMNPARVPFFIANDDWQKRLKKFFIRRGLKIEAYAYSKRVWKHVGKVNKLVIVQGISPRMKKNHKEHATVYRGNKPIFDPHHSQKFIKGNPTWIWVISKK